MRRTITQAIAETVVGIPRALAIIAILYILGTGFVFFRDGIEELRSLEFLRASAVYWLGGVGSVVIYGIYVFVRSFVEPN